MLYDQLRFGESFEIQRKKRLWMFPDKHRFGRSNFRMPGRKTLVTFVESWVQKGGMKTNHSDGSNRKSGLHGNSKQVCI